MVQKGEMEPHRQSRKLRPFALRQALASHRGDTGREVFFCLIFLAAALYVGVLFGTPHYNNWVMKGRVAEIVRQGSYSDAELRAKVQEEFLRLGLSVPSEKIQIERTPNYNPIMSMAWTEDVYFMDYYITSYQFSIKAGGDPEY